MEAIGDPTQISIDIGNLKLDRVTACVRTVLTAQDITLTVEGVDFVVTMAALDSDGSGGVTSGYIGTVDITGLTEFREYQLSAVQAVSGKTLTRSFHPAPAKRDSWKMVVISCEDADYSWPSMYPWLANEMRTSQVPFIAISHIDDLIYVDTLSMNDTDGTGIVAPSLTNTSPQHDYNAMYLASFGLMTNNDCEASGLICYGWLEERRFCRNKVAFFPQLGNHEMEEAGGLVSPTGASKNDTLPNGYHATDPDAAGGFDGTGLLSWQQLFGPLQGPSMQSIDTQANHWSIVLGDVYMGMMDCLAWNDAADNDILFGNNQIDDLLNDVAASDTTMHLIMLPVGLHEPEENPADHLGSYAHNAWANICPEEYKRMFENVGQTPKSLMDLPQTQGGNKGKMTIYSGDTHAGAVRHVSRQINTATQRGLSAVAVTTSGMRKGSGHGSLGVWPYNKRELVTNTNLSQLFHYCQQGEGPIAGPRVREHLTIVERDGLRKCTTIKMYNRTDEAGLEADCVYENTIYDSAPGNWGAPVGFFNSGEGR